MVRLVRLRSKLRPDLRWEEDEEREVGQGRRGAREIGEEDRRQGYTV